MIALATMKTGQAGTVASLETKDDAILRKLMAMGVMPGVSITLEQRFPAYIITAGRTRAALDKETAQIIYVQKGNGN